jgi:hypothetical protein
MAGKTPRTLAAEFRLGRELNPNLKRAVYHASLSLPKTESLDDERWRAIASDYLRGMGFEGSTYVIYRHTDRSHDHIHLVACRIRVTDGSTVSDSWDYRRSEELIRSLEKQYQLEAVPSSRERETRAPTTGEWRRKERTSQVGVRTRLQTLIDKATQNRPTMPQFIHHLKEQGVDVRVGYTRALQVKGISYSLDGIAFSGTHLGKAYTFPGLQKYRGVSYDRSQDEEIRAASSREPIKPSPLPGTRGAEVLPPPPDGGAGEALELKKRLYRLKYEELAGRVRQRPGWEDRPLRDVDVAVARLTLSESSDPSEVGLLLSQCDYARQGKKSLPDAEYRQRVLKYIKEVEEAAQLLGRERERPINQPSQRGFEPEL